MKSSPHPLSRGEYLVRIDFPFEPGKERRAGIGRDFVGVVLGVDNVCADTPA